MKKKLIIGGTGVLLLAGILIGIFFSRPLLASANIAGIRQTVSTIPTRVASTSIRMRLHMKRLQTDEYCEQYYNNLATRLRTSAGSLLNDQKLAAEDTIAQLIKSGRITRAQARQMKQSIEAHQMCGSNGRQRGFRGFGARGELTKYLNSMQAQIANKLGMTQDQLVTQLRAGKSLSDIAAARHVSTSRLRTIVNDAIRSTLRQAVRTGGITQAQANQLISQLQDNPQLMSRLLDGHFGSESINLLPR